MVILVTLVALVTLMTIVKLVPLVPLVRLEPLPNGRPGQTGGRTGGLGESPQKVVQLVGGVHRQLPQSTYPTGQPGIRDGTVEMPQRFIRGSSVSSLYLAPHGPGF